MSQFLSNQGLIYALCEPEDRYGTSGRFYKKGEIRYIGQTVDTPRGRLVKHMNKAFNKKEPTQYHSSKWICKLKELGLDPSIEVIEDQIPISQLDDAERFYIAYFKSLGFNLTNMNEGGQGFTSYYFTDERRKSLSQKMIGNKRNLGNRRSEETRQLQRMGMLGKQNTLGMVHKEESKLQCQKSQPHRKEVLDSKGIVHLSITAAAKYYGISPGSLSFNLNNGKQFKKLNVKFFFNEKK